jgi:FKBP-type peptidyl-prolyl cis-trans isomerase FkpA
MSTREAAMIGHVACPATSLSFTVRLETPLTFTIPARRAAALLSLTRLTACTFGLSFGALYAQAQVRTEPPSLGASDITTPSGLVYRSLTEGTGANPAATDTVKVHYRGTLADGKEFDSSYKRGEPASFPLNRVIPCWTEGVQRMKVGGKALLTIPPDIAYGDRGSPPVIPPKATLVFTVELLAIK